MKLVTATFFLAATAVLFGAAESVRSRSRENDENSRDGSNYEKVSLSPCDVIRIQFDIAAHHQMRIFGVE